MEHRPMMKALKLQAATIAARKRMNDPSIATAIKDGRVQVVRVTYPEHKLGASEVVALTEPLSYAQAIAYLNQ